MYTKFYNTQPARSSLPQSVARFILSTPKIFSTNIALLPKIEQLIKEHEKKKRA